MTTELAWAAGFFDGEGHTGTVTGRTKNLIYLKMAIPQTDPRPLYRFGRAVGVDRVYGPYGPYSDNAQAVYQWHVQGSKTTAVIDLLWPYLSEPKREQIEQAKARLT